MKQNIKTGKVAREELVKGIDILADAVSSTLGPSGRNVLYNEDNNIFSTKDGVTVARKIETVEDPLQNVGVNLIKQASIKTAEKAGDGTTTSTLLAQKMVHKGIKHLNNDSNSTEIKKGVDFATKKVIEYIRKNISEEINSEEQLKQVATISSNNDEEIGVLVSSSLSRVGKDGIVHVEESQSGETFLESVEGIQFDKGYASHYFVTNNETMSCTLIEPYILVVNKRLSQVKDILHLLETISGENKPLLIIAEDIEGEMLATLIVNKARGTLKVCAVKAPDFGDRRKLFMEDISIMTGGELIDSDKGMRLDRFDTKWLGKARLVTVTKEKTTIIDGKGNEEQISSRINEIQSQIELSKTPFEKEKLQDRLAKLSDGVSIIHVGGSTEMEIREKRDRVEDALHATKAAIEQGIIPGGGAALIYASVGASDEIYKELYKKYKPTSDVKLGVDIVLEACKEPMIKILQNSGLSNIDIYDKVNYIEKQSKSKTAKKWIGYNITNDKFENMLEAGIIDPTKVCVEALKNASSVAGTILLTECVISNVEEDKKQQPDYMQGMM